MKQTKWILCTSYRILKVEEFRYQDAYPAKLVLVFINHNTGY